MKTQQTAFLATFSSFLKNISKYLIVGMMVLMFFSIPALAANSITFHQVEMMRTMVIQAQRLGKRGQIFTIYTTYLLEVKYR